MMDDTQIIYAMPNKPLLRKTQLMYTNFHPNIERKSLQAFVVVTNLASKVYRTTHFCNLDRQVLAPPPRPSPPPAVILVKQIKKKNKYNRFYRIKAKFSKQKMKSKVTQACVVMLLVDFHLTSQRRVFRKIKREIEKSNKT